MKINLKELKKFLVESNKHGYAAVADNETTEKDGSHTISYTSGDWRMHDK